jgi:hypothetical protein
MYACSYGRCSGNVEDVWLASQLAHTRVLCAPCIVNSDVHEAYFAVTMSNKSL